jgi:hypothetical protein
MIERQTRYTILLPDPDRQSHALIGRIGRACQGLPEGSMPPASTTHTLVSATETSNPAHSSKAALLFASVRPTWARGPPTRRTRHSASPRLRGQPQYRISQSSAVVLAIKSASKQGRRVPPSEKAWASNQRFTSACAFF